MNVLVTGSAGFVGSALVRVLKAAGHFVIGIDRQPDRRSSYAVRHDLREPLDARQRAQIVALAPQVCVHLASAVGGFLYNVSRAQIPADQAAIDATLIELCGACRCERLVFTSTINVFEVCRTFHHGALDGIDQRSPYAVAKAESERRLAAAFADLTIVRPTNIFGRHQSANHRQFGESHVIPDLLRKLSKERELEVFGDGTQHRNFVHVDDVSAFIVKQLDVRGTHYFNLRSELTLRIADLARELMQLTSRVMPLRFRDEYLQHELFQLPEFDVALAKQAGWSPTVTSLSDGLTR